MFSNFTEETCTGTGATMALAGATTGNIPCSEWFADGDLVSYTIEDSGGTIKVGGIGTYVSATDDITRNDTWNWNGTAVDKSPATNITLSGGTHTIRITPHTGSIIAPRPTTLGLTNSSFPCTNANFHVTNYAGFAINTIYYTPFYHPAYQAYTVMGMNIAAGNAAGNVRVGIYTMGDDGLPDQLVVDSGAMSTASTGSIETSGLDFVLEPGYYFNAMLSDTAIDPQAADSTDKAVMVTTSLDTDKTSCYGCLSASQTYGALPATATAPTADIQARALLVWVDDAR